MGGGGPRPLAEMPAAVAGALRGVAFDVDDTVTEAGRLPSEALAAMERLAAAGLRLVAVTGRPLGWAEAMASQWPVDLAVGENGAGWCWREEASGKLRHGAWLDGPAARARLEVLREGVRRVETDLGLARADDQGSRRYDEAFEAPSTVERRRVFGAVAEELGLRAFVSSVHAHLSAGWDKVEGLRAAHRARWGEPLDAERWLFVGDGLNDAPLFAALPHTVGVANVRGVLAALPVPPRWITQAPRAAGFMELADWLLALRGVAAPAVR